MCQLALVLTEEGEMLGHFQHCWNILSVPPVYFSEGNVHIFPSSNVNVHFILNVFTNILRLLKKMFKTSKYCKQIAR